MPAQLPSKVEELKDFLENFFKSRNIPVRVILFGSRARGTHTEHSDVDLAFDSRENLEEVVRELMELLEESPLPQKVDLIILSKVNDRFKEEIRKEGIVWIDLTR
ncbi:MAG: nucleotidyltransferase domain-containing protein [Desulfurobacteriaceae bacterium]